MQTQLRPPLFLPRKPVALLLPRFLEECFQESPQCRQWFANWSLDMETQILIDDSDPRIWRDLYHDSLWHAEDDDGSPYSFRPLRIPFGTRTDSPTFDPGYSIDFRSARHWGYIGQTGWDWRNRRSLWVGFDFDHLIDHDSGCGLPAEQIEEIARLLAPIPGLILRSSKGGSGRHALYKFAAPYPPTQTHKQHKQLAQYVLKDLSRRCRFDFTENVDHCGEVLWDWAKGVKTNGLQRLN